MDATTLLDSLQSREIALSVADGVLAVDHAGGLTDDDRDMIRTHRSAIMATLEARDRLAGGLCRPWPSLADRPDYPAIATLGDELRAQGLALPLCWLPEPQERAVLRPLPGRRGDGALWFE